MSGSLTLVPAMGLFPSCLVAVSNFNMIVFAMSYNSLLYHVSLLSLGNLFFSNERQKDHGTGWEGR